MRALLVSLFILTLPSVAIAQGGMPGGGMGGGGMGGGGMGGGGMGGGGGRHGGGRGMGDGEGKRGMGEGQGRFAQMKPIAREKMDKPVEEMFRTADVNKDGIVELDELRTVLNAKRDAIIHDRFKKIDANGDKVIDEKEFVAWQQAMGSVAVSDSEARGPGFGNVTEALMPPLGNGQDDQVLRMIIEPLSVDVLVSANTNYDKGVSLEEMLAYEHKRFDSADTDKDGKLSAEELRSLEPGGGRRGGRMGRAGDGQGAGSASEAPPQGNPPAE